MKFTDSNDPLMLEGLKHPFSSIDEAFEAFEAMSEEDKAELLAALEQDLQHPQNPI